jgi:methylenetetrahydrofolate dehydrogenase (NADP+)/methenyltetrahydrofolate cyclohydrolase
MDSRFRGNDRAGKIASFRGASGLHDCHDAKIIDGNALSAEVRESLRQRAAELAAQGVKPCLAVILVGENPASAVYVRNKVKACEKAGVHSLKYEYPRRYVAGEGAAQDRRTQCRPEGAWHPGAAALAAAVRRDEVLEAIAPEKDVDGFHAENVGLLAQGNPRFIPCTPYGVMKMLEFRRCPAGMEAVIVGRSNIVGKPMALLLIGASATVTVCHSQTKDLAFHTRRADVLVAAVGKREDDHRRHGQAGRGGHRRRHQPPADGKLCGDVDFDSAKEVASLITPVPGGVGPMTITMLLANTIESADRAAGK